MLHPISRGSTLILALCAALYGGCGGGSSDGSPDTASTAGSSGSGSSGAPVGGTSSAGAGLGGSPSAGSGGLVAVAGAGTAGASGGSTAGTGGASAGGSAGVGGSSGGGAGAGGAAPTSAPLVYVGSNNGQITYYKLDAAQGQLTLVKSVTAGALPSFLAIDAVHNHLYAVNENDAKVLAFSADANTGDLTPLNTVASGGAGPAFIGLDHTLKFVLVANYDGGTASVFPITANGGLGTPNTLSPGKMTHMILTDPANKFAFVMNLGSNTVAQYVFDATAGTLKPNAVATVKTPANSGPRHMAFHPNGKFAYLIHETSYTLAAYSYDATLGQLSAQPLQTLSTLAPGADGMGNSTAEVVVAPSGNFVYGSNRGNDSIATFSVDSTSGMMKFIGTTPSGGNIPRSFTISADGKLMLVANESGNVTSFSVDVTTGALTKGKSVTAPKAPQFVGIVNWAAAP